MKSLLTDRGLSPAQRKDTKATYKKELEQRTDAMKTCMKESEINPKLMQR